MLDAVDFVLDVLDVHVRSLCHVPADDVSIGDLDDLIGDSLDQRSIGACVRYQLSSFVRQHHLAASARR